MAFKQACTPHLLMCVLYFGLCLKIMGDHRLRIACVLWRMEGCLCVKVTTASISFDAVLLQKVSILPAMLTKEKQEAVVKTSASW